MYSKIGKKNKMDREIVVQSTFFGRYCLDFGLYVFELHPCLPWRRGLLSGVPGDW